MRDDLNTPVTSVEQAMRMEYPDQCAQPCNECPWRKQSVPGYLGPYTATEWLDAAHAEGAIACHKTIPPGGGWGDRTLQCAGLASFRHHVMKTPRNRTIAVGPANPAVLQSNDEFLRHHEGGDEAVRHELDHGWETPDGYVCDGCTVRGHHEHRCHHADAGPACTCKGCNPTPEELAEFKETLNE